MAFTPDNPEDPRDLQAHCDPDKDVVSLLIYSCPEGDFFRDAREWKEIPVDGDWTFNLDGLVRVYVEPEFTYVFDSEDLTGVVTTIEDAILFESVPQEGAPDVTQQ